MSTITDGISAVKYQILDCSLTYVLLDSIENEMVYF